MDATPLYLSFLDRMCAGWSQHVIGVRCGSCLAAVCTAPVRPACLPPKIVRLPFRISCRIPCRSTRRAGGGAGKSFVATPEQVAESSPDWVVVAPCGLDLPTARGEMQASLAQQSWW